MKFSTLYPYGDYARKWINTAGAWEMGVLAIGWVLARGLNFQGNSQDGKYENLELRYFWQELELTYVLILRLGWSGSHLPKTLNTNTTCSSISP